MKICNDVIVRVPNSCQLMTPYVLQEQQDWFEDEIKFLRTFIKPGMNVIDIGANYGVYTLSIAKLIGDSGKIWAFEPTSATAEYLEKSINDNNFNNITLIKAGLSDRIGKARLFTSPNAELNSLHKECVGGDNSETIMLLTLDHCKKKYKWDNIDFIKLDAEGEERNILKKGKNTLSTLSPLIMYELKHGEKVNTPLISLFAQNNYSSYRLIPGLNILVPFDSDRPFDGFLLNLFCCNDEKGKLLEAEGVIVSEWEHFDNFHDKGLRQISLSSLTADGLFDESSASAEYLEILKMYMLSKSQDIESCTRLSCLMTSLEKLRNLIDSGENKIEKLATLSRMAFDAGQRDWGMRILANLINRYHAKMDFEVHEPLAPPCARYDTLVPNRDNIKAWLFSSILEQYINKHAFSTYFTRLATLPLIERLEHLGFAGEGMRRRKDLMVQCFAQG